MYVAKSKSKKSPLKQIILGGVIIILLLALINTASKNKRLNQQLISSDQPATQSGEPSAPRVNRTSDGVSVTISEATLTNELNKNLGTQSSDNPVTNHTVTINDHQATIVATLQQGQTITATVITSSDSKSLVITNTQVKGAGLFNQAISQFSQKLLQGVVDSWTNAQQGRLKSITLQEGQLLLTY